MENILLRDIVKFCDKIYCYIWDKRILAMKAAAIIVGIAIIAKLYGTVKTRKNKKIKVIKNGLRWYDEKTG